MSHTTLLKAVFPVVDLGTRFLPATKASLKEMVPVFDKPLIQYAVEEAVAAGITDLIFVTGRNKRAIEDHFDSSPELEIELQSKAKHQLLEMVQNILPKYVSCIFCAPTHGIGPRACGAVRPSGGPHRPFRRSFGR